MATELLLHPNTASQAAKLIENTAHAVLVTGPLGAGKTSLSEYIASQILKAREPSTQPYYKKIDASEGDGIAQVRDIRKFLSLKTTGANIIRRVVVVENVDMLGGDAQNALLKTLEEPPLDTVIVLTACQQGRVLDTIRSRVNVLAILPLTKSVCMDYQGYSAVELQKAFAFSGGLAGSFVALLNNGQDHPLVQSVAIAKTFLGQTVFERLCSSEAIAKEKQEVEKLLIGLEMCLHAALTQSKTGAIKPVHTKLATVDSARRAFSNNANTKLLLTSLAVTL